MSPADHIALFESRMALSDALLIRGLVDSTEYERLRVAALAGIGIQTPQPSQGCAAAPIHSDGSEEKS